METLRNYLDQMFARYPETPEAIRAKAELWQMMEDKYNELTSGGAKESEAVGTVIAEFGDLEEVADSLGISTMLATTEPAAEKAASVSSNETVESANTGEKTTGAAESSPTLIFGGPSIFDTDNKRNTAASSDAVDVQQDTAYTTTNDTIEVETDTAGGENTGERNGAWWAWHNSYDDSAAGQRIFNASNTVLSVYWPTVTCIYLCWSFLTFRWWITWIIWPLAAVLHSVLKRLIVGDMNARGGRVYKSRLLAAVLDSYWPCVVFVYFAVSFITGLWAVSWLIFVIAPFFRNYLKRISTDGEVE
ncbi:MAG: permease prefix domain 1-containing protein [Lachnospiraceae bacterium]|nr:permease prefix domain 1-containing protein [Lachnospiraceae bacterium]